jgi:hypothetical protein
MNVHSTGGADGRSDDGPDEDPYPETLPGHSFPLSCTGARRDRLARDAMARSLNALRVTAEGVAIAGDRSGPHARGRIADQPRAARMRP